MDAEEALAEAMPKAVMWSALASRPADQGDEVTDQPSLWDAHGPNLERVSSRIGLYVLAFCRRRVGAMFHMEELHAYVYEHAKIAPASADRVLRDLKQRGVLDYEVVNRRQSLYWVKAVQA